MIPGQGECPAVEDVCICGECGVDNTCNYDSSGNKPDTLCLVPLTDTGCNQSNSDATVYLTPPGGDKCMGNVTFDANPLLCPGGWYINRTDLAENSNGGCDGKDFFNSLGVSTTCAGEVEIHTSCSCEIGLCDKFGDYIIYGYTIDETYTYTRDK